VSNVEDLDRVEADVVSCVGRDGKAKLVSRRGLSKEERDEGRCGRDARDSEVMRRRGD